MITVSMVKTFDGALHGTHEDARRHIDKIYGELLTGLAHKLVRLEKYAAMADFIDANLAAFEELAAIKRDLIVTKESD